MADHFCDRCGEYLPDGSLRFTVHVQILSDFDGMILLDGDYPNSDLDAAYREAESMASGDPEDEVYQELAFILCSKCKKRFIRDPFNRGGTLFRNGNNMERLFH